MQGAGDYSATSTTAQLTLLSRTKLPLLLMWVHKEAVLSALYWASACLFGFCSPHYGLLSPCCRLALALLVSA
jgi:hypothetical protein